MNWKNVKAYLVHYLYGLLVKSFTGGISALDAFLGLAAGAAVTTQIDAINWQGALAVFAVTFLRTALGYFRDNPFPPDFPSDVVTVTSKETSVSVSTKAQEQNT